MADLTYQQLVQAVQDLEKDIARSADAIRARAAEILDEAKTTAHDADCIGAMGVDKDTVAETHDLSKMMAGLSDAVIAYAAAGDDTAKAAKAAGDQARSSHGGIQEAVSRATFDTRDLKSEWLRQE